MWQPKTNHKGELNGLRELKTTESRHDLLEFGLKSVHV